MATAATAGAEVDRVRELLEDYARRGFFHGIGAGEHSRGRTTFSILWHHRRRFRLVVDPARGVASFPALLPEVSPRSPMVRELKAFLARFASEEAPPHRRVDPARARLRVAARAGTVSVAITALDDDLVGATRRLVHLAHEVFMVFLPDGPYDAYRVEQLGLDPDLAWA